MQMEGCCVGVHVAWGRRVFGSQNPPESQKATLGAGRQVPLLGLRFKVLAAL